MFSNTHFYLVVVCTLLIGCSTDPTTVELPTEAVVLEYDSTNRQFNWAADTDFEFMVENSFSTADAVAFTAVSTSANNFYSLVETDSGLYRVRVCLTDGTCSELVSNQITVERENFLRVSPSGVFWRPLAGFSGYRVDSTAIVGGDFVLLAETTETSLDLPAILPGALRFYACTGLCDDAGSKLIDEIILANLEVPAEWQQQNIDFDSAAPELIGSAQLATNRKDQPQSALLLSEDGQFSSADFGLQDFSIALWFNSSESSGTLVERRSDDDDYWSIELDQNQLFLRLSSDGENADQQLFLGAIDTSVNNWHHLFFQYQSSGDATVRLGIDGDISALTLDAVQSTRFSSASGNLLFGATKGTEGTNYVGKIDDITILNRALFDTADRSNYDAYSYIIALVLDLYHQNYYPVAISPSLSEVAEDSSTSLTLVASDQDGAVGSLTFSVATQPSNGSVTISEDQASYTPNANYFGSDSFTFVATDSESATSAPVSVQISIIAVNDVPTISVASVFTAQNVVSTFVVVATDSDNDSLTYSIVSSPSNGTLAVDAEVVGQFQYQSVASFLGEDSATIAVSDGFSTVSTIVQFFIVVTQVPVADEKAVDIDEDFVTTITLSGTDPDGDNSALTFTLASQSSNGVVEIDGDQVLYTPNANYYGEDSFSYRATDVNNASSAPVLVSITIAAVNDVPLVSAASGSEAEDTAVVIELTGSDIEDQSSVLQYVVASQPSNGSVEIVGNQATYTPNSHYNGADSFSIQAVDSNAASSDPALVSISISAVNDAPVAVADSVSTNEDTAVNIGLTASDVENDSSLLTYTIVTAPSDGIAELNGAIATYTPHDDYNGEDSFSFRVTDSDGLTSTVAVVAISITAVNDAPVASAVSVTTDEDTAVAIGLVAFGH